MPADFSLISPTGPDAAILASVPGTVAAQEALLKAQIPTTATFQRSAAKLTVIYSGPPHFVPITGTTMLYAVNTNAYVLQIGTGYYACEGGAWFVSATPIGPWLLADSVPAVVHTIPPASPMYHVTYVQVYAVTPVAVTYGFTSGYTLGYVSYGVLVYGTGYYYPPVIIAGPVPIFYPYPYTYAGAVWYNASSGVWARGGIVYGPYGGAVAGASYYNPNTGAYAHGAAVYGPNGGAGAWSAYNPSTGSYAHGSASWSNGSGSGTASYYNARTGVSGTTNQNVNPYGRSGSSTFSGPNQTINTQSGANANGRAGGFNSSTGAKGAGYQNNVTGGSGGAVKTQNGDVYAGHDGNVYQHTDNGWSKYDNGSWNPVQPPANGTKTPPAKEIPATLRAAAAVRAAAVRAAVPWIAADISNWIRIGSAARPAAAVGVTARIQAPAAPEPRAQDRGRIRRELSTRSCIVMRRIRLLVPGFYSHLLYSAGARATAHRCATFCDSQRLSQRLQERLRRRTDGR